MVARTVAGAGGGRVLIASGWIDGFDLRPDQVREWLNPEALPTSLDIAGDVTVNGGIGYLDDDHTNGDAGSRLFQHLPLPLNGTMIFLR